MDKILNVLNKVKRAVTPNSDEIKQVSGFLKTLDMHKSNMLIDAEIMLGGSVGKGTFLKNDFDCDIFVRYGKQYPNEKLSDLTEQILKKFTKPHRIHGSRDYFQIKDSGIDYEIIPVYRIEKAKDAENITDTSPMHVAWVKKHLKLKSKLADEIRITKKFFKANDLYGAESYIMGFSGHVIDIMVIYYGGFIELLNASIEWKESSVIDIESHYKGKDVVKSLNKSKINSPLIIIDPIQKNRNAAAALSADNFHLLQKTAKVFLTNPTMSSFVQKKESVSSLRKKYPDNLVILQGFPTIGNHDVVGCRILKSYKYLKTQLKVNGFEVLNGGWQWQKNKLFYMWFNLENLMIDSSYISMGPPVKNKLACLRFKNKHFGAYEEKGRLYTKVNRKYNNALTLISMLFMDKNVADKVKSIKII